VQIGERLQVALRCDMNLIGPPGEERNVGDEGIIAGNDSPSVPLLLCDDVADQAASGLLPVLERTLQFASDDRRYKGVGIDLPVGMIERNADCLPLIFE